MNTTTRTRHARGVQDGFRKFWRDYEIRNSGPTLAERVEELERLVAMLLRERA
jgi:hypothetical protein